MSAPVRIPSSLFRLALAQGVSGLALLLAAPGSLAASADTPLPEILITAPAPNDAAPIGPPATSALAEGSAEVGYRVSTGAFGPLGKVPLQDVPYSLNVTSGELIENTNAHSIGAALATNPTATLLMSSGGYSSMSRMMIRGFTAADQDEMRDGLVDRSFEYVPLENVQRIEVLNGFSAFLNGFSEPGGTVNYVGKEPTATPLATLATGFYGGGIGFVHADLGGKIAETDDKLGYRINLYHEDGQTMIANSDQNRSLVSSRFTYDLTPDTKLWTDVYYQELFMRGLQTYINPANLGTSKALLVPDASAFMMSRQYGQDWTFNKAEKTVVGFGFDSKLNDIFSLRGGLRYGAMWRSYSFVDATLTNNKGAYTEQVTEDRPQTEYTRSEYALLDARIPTWVVTHNLTMGYTGTDYLYSRGADEKQNLLASTIELPTISPNPNLPLGQTTQWQQQVYDNLLFADRMTLERFTLLGGVNYAQLIQRAWGPGTSISTANYHADGASPALALEYRFLPNLMSYVSYMQALEAGDTAPSTAANANQVLAPSASQQYEAGVKSTLGGVNLSAALFRIEKVNAELNPNSNVYMQDGREIHQGLEVILTGRLWRISPPSAASRSCTPSSTRRPRCL